MRSISHGPMQASSSARLLNDAHDSGGGIETSSSLLPAHTFMLDKGGEKDRADQPGSGGGVGRRHDLASYDAFAGGTVRYVDDRNANFDLATGMPQYALPDYTAVDFRTSLTIGGTRFQLYCKNLTNERGQLSAVTGTSLLGGPANVSVLQPRTYGLSVDVSF